MSRFDDLLRQRKPANPDNETSECLDVWMSKRSDTQTSKSKNPSYQRTTIYLRKELHTKLKTAAIVEGMEMSEVIETLIEQWLESRHRDAQ